MKLQITIGSRRYEAEVEVLPDEGPLPQGASSPSPAAQATPPAAPHPTGRSAPVSALAPGEVRSAVMGIVTKVQVSAGQKVEAGAELLTLEAMKMESAVKAPRAAVVRQVHVAPGDSVKKDQVLLVLD